MSSSNSSEMEDQLTMAFQGVIEEAMSMLQAEEAAAAAVRNRTLTLIEREDDTRS
jgi:hypothetical protein